MFEAYNSIILITIILLVFISFVSLSSIFLSTNTIISTFSLIIVFLISSLFLFILDFEFLAIIYTTVYVGAVSVFFIFVIMTINLRFEDSSEYNDEIYSDKNFSLLILFLFSSLMQFFLYAQFKNFFNVKFLIEMYERFSFNLSYWAKAKSFFDTTTYYSSAKKALVFRDQPSFGIIDSAFYDNTVPYLCSNSYQILNILPKTTVHHINQYVDVYAISHSIFTELKIIFFILTFILLLSMISSVGFAIRSK